MNRREALARGVAVLAFAPVAASAASPVDRSEWDAALAAFDRIRADEAVFDPMWHETYARCRAACEAVPHVTVGSDPYRGRTVPVGTDDTRYVAYARRMVADLAADRRRHDPLPVLRRHERLCRKLASAADERDLEIQAIRDRFNMDALDQQAEELGEALAEAQGRLMDIPAPDIAALRWKLEHVIAEEGAGGVPPWSAEYVAQTVEDLRRLLPTDSSLA